MDMETLEGNKVILPPKTKGGVSAKKLTEMDLQGKYLIFPKVKINKIWTTVEESCV